jgi:hypothetical protein
MTAPGSRAALEALAAQARRLATLGQALRWAFALRPSWTVAEIVTQDEYTNDVVLTAEGAPGAIVLDCT